MSTFKRVQIVGFADAEAHFPDAHADGFAELQGIGLAFGIHFARALHDLFEFLQTARCAAQKLGEPVELGLHFLAQFADQLRERGRARTNFLGSGDGFDGATQLRGFAGQVARHRDAIDEVEQRLARAVDTAPVVGGQRQAFRNCRRSLFDLLKQFCRVALGGDALAHALDFQQQRRRQLQVIEEMVKQIRLLGTRGSDAGWRRRTADSRFQVECDDGIDDFVN